MVVAVGAAELVAAVAVGAVGVVDNPVLSYRHHFVGTSTKSLD